MTMNDNIQNTKQLIILYFNNDKDYFSFNLIEQPSSSLILFNWTYQAFSAKVVSMTRTAKVDGVLIEYNYDDTSSIVSLVRDKDFTKIDVRTYNFTEKGCLACYTYKTSLFNSACKFTRFNLL